MPYFVAMKIYFKSNSIQWEKFTNLLIKIRFEDQSCADKQKNLEKQLYSCYKIKSYRYIHKNNSELEIEFENEEDALMFLLK